MGEDLRASISNSNQNRQGNPELPLPRYRILVEKAVAACLSAIEVYNKPSFQYREETFSILMLNAWELVLKARVLQFNGGKMRAIEVWQPAIKNDGTESKKLQKRLNRSGNVMTIGLDKCMNIVKNYQQNSIDERCIANLHLLAEVRDNAIHFNNPHAGLAKRVQEVGCAALKNFVVAVEQWFALDLSRYNFYLMPVAFYSAPEVLESLQVGSQSKVAKRLLERISEVERDNPPDESARFNVTLQIQLKFLRTPSSEAIPVRVTPGDPSAVKIAMTEDDIRNQYPWDYAELGKRLRSRYSDFLQNNKYHKIRKQFEGNPSFCRVRYLDPSNIGKGPKKRFYNPNILKQFDSYYSKI